MRIGGLERSARLVPFPPGFEQFDPDPLDT
jgi:hypothetical protein